MCVALDHDTAEVFTADQLFATLDPTTRKVVITEPETQERRSILLTDTVGLIHELPPLLMDAFRATLEEVVEADAMIHVVDLSHPAWKSHIASVLEILQKMPEIPEKSLIKVKGEAGCILIDRQGRVGWAYNSSHMACAYMTEGQDKVAVFTKK